MDHAIIGVLVFVLIVVVLVWAAAAAGWPMNAQVIDLAIVGLGTFLLGAGAAAALLPMGARQRAATERYKGAYLDAISRLGYARGGLTSIGNDLGILAKAVKEIERRTGAK